jgi:hypothetical protein
MKDKYEILAIEVDGVGRIVSGRGVSISKFQKGGKSLYRVVGPEGEEVFDEEATFLVMSGPKEGKRFLSRPRRKRQ